MPILTALRTLTGDYGHVQEGQQFTATDGQAESLEARGLAVRYRPPVPRPEPASFVPTYQTKVIVPEDLRKRR